MNTDDLRRVQKLVRAGLGSDGTPHGVLCTLLDVCVEIFERLDVIERVVEHSETVQDEARDYWREERSDRLRKYMDAVCNDCIRWRDESCSLTQREERADAGVPCLRRVEVP